MFGDELEKVSALEVLGDNAEHLVGLIIEGIFVGENMWVIDAS
jgi:hypothetical protein